MSDRKTTCSRCAGTILGVEDPEQFVNRSNETSTNNLEAAVEEYSPYQRTNSPTNIEAERKHTFHAVAEAVVSEERPASS